MDDRLGRQGLHIGDIIAPRQALLLDSEKGILVITLINMADVGSEVFMGFIKLGGAERSTSTGGGSPPRL